MYFHDTFINESIHFVMFSQTHWNTCWYHYENGSNEYSKTAFWVSYYYIKKITFHFKIWGSHGGTYEQYYVLGCDTV
jgi:hypothetical protein